MGISLDTVLFFGAQLDLDHEDQPWNDEDFISNVESGGEWSTEKTRSTTYFENHDIHFIMHGYGEETEPAPCYSGTVKTLWGGEVMEIPDDIRNEANNRQMRDELVAQMEKAGIVWEYEPRWYVTSLCW